MLFWLEVLGVSRLIGEAYWALRSAEEWFQVSLLICNMECPSPPVTLNQQRRIEYEELLMFIKDGIKFVRNFAGIIDKSTPHLYLSALPFSPSKSILARSLTAQFAGIAQVAVGQQDDWPWYQQVHQVHAMVLSVACSSNGRHIVSGSWDGTIQLWDVQTGGQVGNSLQGHTGPVYSVAFSPDGRHIVSGSRDKCNRSVFFFFFLSNLRLDCILSYRT